MALRMSLQAQASQPCTAFGDQHPPHTRTVGQPDAHCSWCPGATPSPVHLVSRGYPQPHAWMPGACGPPTTRLCHASFKGGSQGGPLPWVTALAEWPGAGRGPRQAPAGGCPFPATGRPTPELSTSCRHQTAPWPASAFQQGREPARPPREGRQDMDVPRARSLRVQGWPVQAEVLTQMWPQRPKLRGRLSGGLIQPAGASPDPKDLRPHWLQQAGNAVTASHRERPPRQGPAPGLDNTAQVGSPQSQFQEGHAILGTPKRTAGHKHIRTWEVQ